MKEIVNKIGKLAKELIQERGDIAFLALVLREDDIAWEIVISAQWIDDNRSEALDYLVAKVQKALTKIELLSISSIVFLQRSYFSENPPNWEAYTGWEENDIDLYGIAVKKAFIFLASDTELQVARA